MNIIDLFIIIFAIGALFRGLEIGFVRQFFSTVGFLGGLWLGALLQPHIVHWAHTDMSKTVLTLTTTLGCAFIFLAVGEYVGVVIKRRIMSHSINPFDYALGAGLAVISLLLTVWLSANIFASLPYQSTKEAIQGSSVVRLLNRSLPSAPGVIADLGHLIDPNGFPDVFAGVEPVPASKLPQPGLRGFQTAIAADQISVVKIEGQGCGGIVEGSGFVADNNLVMTNAHVVAGISHIIVEDQKGSHTAVPIWFDPDLDFAVLRVSDLAGKPLDFDASTQKRGTAGAVLGYPGGGAFTAKSAAYLDEFIATGRNIYGTGETKRDVYEVQADIIPGNSGGPIINQHGQVTSVVFAESTSYQHIGYSLDVHKLLSELQTAKDQNRFRNTGSCAE